MYEIGWYFQAAVVLTTLIETFKRSGGHWLRDELLPKVPKVTAENYYPAIIKGIAFAIALVLCFGAKADVLITLEIEGFDPKIGYAVGAILVFGGGTFIDAAWDKRKIIAELADAFVKGKIDASTN